MPVENANGLVQVLPDWAVVPAAIVNDLHLASPYDHHASALHTAAAHEFRMNRGRVPAIEVAILGNDIRIAANQVHTIALVMTANSHRIVQVRMKA